MAELDAANRASGIQRIDGLRAEDWLAALSGSAAPAAAPPIRATRRSLTLDRLTPVVEQAQPDQRLQNKRRRVSGA
jgi:hypothetical protein